MIQHTYTHGDAFGNQNISNERAFPKGIAKILGKTLIGAGIVGLWALTIGFAELKLRPLMEGRALYNKTLTEVARETFTSPFPADYEKRVIVEEAIGNRHNLSFTEKVELLNAYRERLSQPVTGTQTNLRNELYEEFRGE